MILGAHLGGGLIAFLLTYSAPAAVRRMIRGGGAREPTPATPSNGGVSIYFRLKELVHAAFIVLGMALSALCHR